MSRSKGLSYDIHSEGSINGDTVFQCEDDRGNGCGRLFDETEVKKVVGLCPSCAEDVLPNEDC